MLKGSKRFDTLRKQLLEIASALEDQTGIPAIAHQAALIEEIQTDHWWEGVTVPLLELVRLRLRDLVQHIEKSQEGDRLFELRRRDRRGRRTSSCRRSARPTSPASSRRRGIS